MKVNAEVRDIKKLRTAIAGIIVFWSIYLILTIGSIVLAGTVKGRAFVIATVILILLLVPLAITSFAVANNIYKNSWMMKLFELSVKDGRLYCEGKALHAEYNEAKDIIYVHDMGDSGNPAVATIYLTILGEDKDKLKDLMDKYGIEPETIPQGKGKGKYGRITSMNLSASRYRRR